MCVCAGGKCNSLVAHGRSVEVLYRFGCLRRSMRYKIDIGLIFFSADEFLGASSLWNCLKEDLISFLSIYVDICVCVC